MGLNPGLRRVVTRERIRIDRKVVDLVIGVSQSTQIPGTATFLNR
jgi:hypothetical protein